jgi:hypothetical protein
MAQLTIAFQNLAAFVHWKLGLTVLIPSKGHKATITSDLGLNLDLTGELFQLLQDGAPIRTGTKHSSGKYLVNIGDVLPVSSILLPSGALSTKTLGRFELGDGKLVDNRSKTAPEKYRDFAWTFTERFSHKLTDSVEFQLPLDQASTYGLLISRGAESRIVPVPSNQGDVRFDVTVSEDHEQRKFGKSIDEFAFLYELFYLPAGQDPRGLPLPTDPNGDLAPPHVPGLLCDFPLCPSCEFF